MDTMDYEEIIKNCESEIVRYEKIRLIYLDNRLEADWIDWVNNRMDNFISKENKRIANFRRMMRHQKKSGKSVDTVILYHSK